MQQENLMGTMPIPQLIIKTSIPLIISLLVNNLYNLVDSIFVSRVSEEALTGIALAAPLQMIMIALGCGLAVGLNAMVSKALGEKKQEEVKKTTSAAIVMAFGAYLINAAVCLLAVKPYFAWQAGGNETIAEYGSVYIRICMLFSFGQMIQWVFDRLLIATGKSTLFSCDARNRIHSESDTGSDTDIRVFRFSCPGYRRGRHSNGYGTDCRRASGNLAEYKEE